MRIFNIMFLLTIIGGLLMILLFPVSSHARVFISGGVVTTGAYYPYYSSPILYDPYYYPAYPAYYPAPVYPSPAPAYPAQQAGAPSGAPLDTSYCREYTRQATIDGKRQTVYGHACRQPDGQWKDVN